MQKEQKFILRLERYKVLKRVDVLDTSDKNKLK